MIIKASALCRGLRSCQVGKEGEGGKETWWERHSSAMGQTPGFVEGHESPGGWLSYRSRQHYGWKDAFQIITAHRQIIYTWIMGPLIHNPGSPTCYHFKKKLIDIVFQSSFRFTEKLSRKYSEFPSTPHLSCPLPVAPSLTFYISVTFDKNGE